MVVRNFFVLDVSFIEVPVSVSILIFASSLLDQSLVDMRKTQHSHP